MVGDKFSKKKTRGTKKKKKNKQEQHLLQTKLVFKNDYYAK